MEDSPITLAHAHAWNAVLETRRSNAVAASEEHDLAAAEFARAAEKTADAEALRTLHLLEQHHRQLGHILRFRHEKSQSSDKLDTVDNAQGINSTRKVSDPASGDIAKHIIGPETLQQPPRLVGGTRATARDLSSSIASNLASARGIPGGHRRGAPASPTLSAQHVPGKFAKDQAKTREAQGTTKTSKLQSGFFTSNDRSSDVKPSWAPPANLTSNEPPIAPAPAIESAASVNDAPFQQFYTTLESLMSKLSAPLAFAGLPLVSGTNLTSQLDKQGKSKEPPPPAVELEPDYSQMISRAALRAVQVGQFSSNPAESFYVVPTTGGMLSYADIMTRADREASTLRHTRHLSNVSEDNVEDFVDAKETLPPAAPRNQDNTDSKPHAPSRLRNTIPASTSSSSQQKNPSAMTAKSLEELTVTNAALRKLTDTLSKRLQVFEASAQSSSAALAHSIRSISARSNPDNSQGKTEDRDDKAAARIAELEDILRKSDRELARRERENAKLRETVGRYREKWEKLKEGARARRGDGAAAAPTSGKGDDAPSVAPSSVE